MSKRSNRDSGSERAAGRGDELLASNAEQARELLEFERSSQLRASIKVVGVGGGVTSRTNTSYVPFVSPSTRFEAKDSNTATEPSAASDARKLFPLASA